MVTSFPAALRRRRGGGQMLRGGARVMRGRTSPPPVVGAPSGPCWLIRPGAGISSRAVGVQLRQMRSIVGVGFRSPTSFCPRAGRAATISSRMNAVVLIKVVPGRPKLEFPGATTDAMIVDIRMGFTLMVETSQPKATGPDPHRDGSRAPPDHGPRHCAEACGGT